VVSILLFSHHHQATDLKECAQVYMMQNLSESVVNEHLSELKEDPDVMFEVLLDLLFERNRKKQNERGESDQDDVLGDA
jgi:hypothetical protein